MEKEYKKPLAVPYSSLFYLPLQAFNLNQARNGRFKPAIVRGRVFTNVTGGTLRVALPLVVNKHKEAE
jgi:hypothetical protein